MRGQSVVRWREPVAPEPFQHFDDKTAAMPRATEKTADLYPAIQLALNGGVFETAVERGTRVHQEAEADLLRSYVDWPTPTGAAPPMWKCARHGCPDRAPVTGPTVPKCYTCDLPMARAEPRFEKQSTTRDVVDALTYMQNKVAAACAMPAELLKSEPRHSRSYNEPLERPISYPAPRGTKPGDLADGLAKIPGVQAANVNTWQPGWVQAFVHWIPGQRYDLMTGSAILSWLRQYGSAGVQYSVRISYFVDGVLHYQLVTSPPMVPHPQVLLQE